MSLNQPGVYTIPEDEYHADPIEGGSLSSSGARKILPPGCPAKYKHERDNGSGHKAVFDFGHAAHALVLGVGAELVVVDADSWRTKAAKEAQEAAYAAGRVPLLPEDMRTVQAMAEVIKSDPIASALFDPDRGKPEQSLFWTDDLTGVNLRARLDWLPDASNGRMIIGDYKTTISAEPDSFAKSCASYGYHQQAAFYEDGVRALGLADEIAFVFVAQEKTAPYLVTVFELDREAIEIGRALNRQAIEVYAECQATNEWPSYTDEVALISLPAWYLRQHYNHLEMTA